MNSKFSSNLEKSVSARRQRSYGFSLYSHFKVFEPYEGLNLHVIVYYLYMYPAHSFSGSNLPFNFPALALITRLNNATFYPLFFFLFSSESR